MEDERRELSEQVALFRYGLIADLLHLEPGITLADKLQQKAQRDYAIPGSRRVRVAAETIRDWLKKYRRDGFDALRPKLRSDVGCCRTVPQSVSDLLCAIKEDRRDLTVKQVIECARTSGEVPQDLPLPASTVHRLLSAAGLMDKRPDEPTDKDRRRFAFEKAGQLWMSDVMHGPAVPIDGKRKRKTYLIAFIDDATRVLPHAAFAFSENTEAFLPVFKTALMRRGLPLRLFVDNGAAFRSHQLCLVCAKLGVALIHGRPYAPQGRGKIERLFRTIRMQLLAALTAGDLANLEALNRRLWGYIEGEYHHSPHRGLGGQTPLDRWAASADEVRFLGPKVDLDDLFLWETKRKVQRDRTVSLKGTLYEVDASLVGQTVTLRYDPAHPGRPIQVVHDGCVVGKATVVDAYANCFVKRDRPSLTLSAHKKAEPPAHTLRLSVLNRNDDKENR
jgi:transposase InsO family protein